MQLHCSKCASAYPENARFCPNCGRRLDPDDAPAMSRHALTAVLLLALLLWGAAWTSQRRLAGERPGPAPADRPAAARQSGHSMQQAELSSDPGIKQLYAEAEKYPTDVNKKKALAQGLLAKLQESQAPSAGSIMETISALRQVIELDPSDADSYRAMASISFSSGVFDKAADFYVNYLELRPEDNQVRSEYGAALLMIGRSDEAVTELQRVLTAEPAHFHALVNMAVAQLKRGEEDAYRKAKDAALAKAPEGEREQLRRLLADLEKKPLQ